MTDLPTNNRDIIDSREIIERIEELQGQIMDKWDREELKILLALQEEAGGSPDWRYGEALIRDSYFKEYARDLADDIGAIDHSATWPSDCIDWDQAVRELQMDYTSVEFGDVTYWIRS